MFGLVVVGMSVIVFAAVVLIVVFQAKEALADGEITAIQTSEGTMYQIKTATWTEGRKISHTKGWQGRTFLVALLFLLFIYLLVCLSMNLSIYLSI